MGLEHPLIWYPWKVVESVPLEYKGMITLLLVKKKKKKEEENALKVDSIKKSTNQSINGGLAVWLKW